MNGTFSLIIDYLVNVGKVSLLQLLVLFGPLLFLAFLMHFLSLLNQYLSFNTLGKTIYIYLFGWLGITFHEMGHAMFAVLFGHKVKEIKLFKPDPKSGSMGYVMHSYNTKNIYHQIGNFFIGIGPVLMCVFVLYLLSRFLIKVPFSKFPTFEFLPDGFGAWAWVKQQTIDSWASISIFFGSIYNDDHSSWWKLLLFIYFFYAVGSFITLSPSDIKSAGMGFMIIVLLFLIFNVCTLWMGNFALTGLTKVNFFLSGFYSIMLLAILLQLVFIAILSIFYLLFKLLIK
jgi:hypothetical protein